MIKKYNKTYIIIFVVVLLLSIIIGGYVLTHLNTDNNVNLEENNINFESTSIKMSESELHLNETVEHFFRFDGQLVTSDASNHINIPKNEISQYTWKTDGEEYNSQKLMHFYEDNGMKNIKLEVKDNNGQTFSDEITIETQGIKKNNVGVNTYEFTAPDTILSNEENVTYQWTVEHGEVKEGKTIRHTYQGSYITIVELEIIHEDGDTRIIKSRPVES